MTSISGQEYLFNMQQKAELGSERQVFFQNLIGAFAGLLYFLIGMGQVMRGDAAEMSAIHVLYLAAPAAIIALGWAGLALVIFMALRRRSVRAVRKVFAATDLAVVLMQPQLPEQLRAPAMYARAGPAPADRKAAPEFTHRLDWLQAEYETVCYRLGSAGHPWRRVLVDAVLVLAALAGIVLVLIPGYHPALFLAGVGLILAAINAKLIIEAARAYGLRLVLFEVFAGEHHAQDG